MGPLDRVQIRQSGRRDNGVDSDDTPGGDRSTLHTSGSCPVENDDEDNDWGTFRSTRNRPGQKTGNEKTPRTKGTKISPSSNFSSSALGSSCSTRPTHSPTGLPGPLPDPALLPSSPTALRPQKTECGQIETERGARRSADGTIWSRATRRLPRTELRNPVEVSSDPHLRSHPGVRTGKPGREGMGHVTHSHSPRHGAQGHPSVESRRVGSPRRIVNLQSGGRTFPHDPL